MNPFSLIIRAVMISAMALLFTATGALAAPITELNRAVFTERCDLLANTMANRTGHMAMTVRSCVPLAEIVKGQPLKGQKAPEGKTGGKSIIIDGIDFGDDSSAWSNDGECDDPRFRGPGVAVELVQDDLMHDATDCSTLYNEGLVELTPDPEDAADTIDFGNNTSQWARDGECDDPRFDGPGSASTLLDEDMGRDADDCRRLFLNGELIYLGDDPNMEILEVDGINFGDNTSQWASDGECDDPRFEGQGMAATLVEEDRAHDAEDCLALYRSGAIRLIDTSTSTNSSDINFGDDSSDWANDGECDDPRFEGPGTAAILLEDDLGHDATDCRALFEGGQITLIGASGTPTADPVIDFGDDTSAWANDGECDDPRFEGPGSAATLLDEDLGHDATDCRSLYQSGQITLIGGAPAAGDVVVDGIDFGDDTSTWANDGECDDPRFEGNGVAGILLEEDLGHDATDCRTLYENGDITFIGTTEPLSDMPSSGIDFGDDSSAWANDGECDDPRFEGPGAAATLLDDDLGRDATDCRTLYEAGEVTLVGDANNTDVIVNPGGNMIVDGIDFGDDTSAWANDNQCDDPRFEGEGVADIVLDEDLGHDATDCLAEYQAGRATLVGDASMSEGNDMAHPSGIEFGDDSSIWANDGECDDARFEGEGMASVIDNESVMTDASDCIAAFDAGTITLASQ